MALYREMEHSRTNSLVHMYITGFFNEKRTENASQTWEDNIN